MDVPAVENGSNTVRTATEKLRTVAVNVRTAQEKFQTDDVSRSNGG